MFPERGDLPGLFRLGDQAAVIASLTGDGVALALASGGLAAAHGSRAAMPKPIIDVSPPACRVSCGSLRWFIDFA